MTQELIDQDKMPRKTLKDIARKATEYDPRYRYGSLEEMLEDFNPPKPRRDYSVLKRVGKVVVSVGLAGILAFGGIKGCSSYSASRAEARFNQYQTEFVLVQQDVASGNYESADARAEAIMQKMLRDGHKGVPELLEEIARYDDKTIDVGVRKVQEARAEQERTAKAKEEERQGKERLEGYKRDYALIRQDAAAGRYEQADKNIESLIGKMKRDPDPNVTPLLAEVTSYDNRSINPKIRQINQRRMVDAQIQDTIKRYTSREEDVVLGGGVNPAYFGIYEGSVGAFVSPDKKHILLGVTEARAKTDGLEYGIAVVDADGGNSKILVNPDSWFTGHISNYEPFWIDNNTVGFKRENTKEYEGARYYQIDFDGHNNGFNLRPYRPK